MADRVSRREKVRGSNPLSSTKPAGQGRARHPERGRQHGLSALTRTVYAFAWGALGVLVRRPRSIGAPGRAFGGLRLPHALWRAGPVAGHHRLGLLGHRPPAPIERSAGPDRAPCGPSGPPRPVLDPRPCPTPPGPAAERRRPAKHRHRIDRTTIRGTRDAAILLLGFAGARRRSELAALTLADLETKPGGRLVHLRRSKTDPGRGQVVRIAHGKHGLTDPIAALPWPASVSNASPPRPDTAASTSSSSATSAPSKPCTHPHPRPRPMTRPPRRDDGQLLPVG